MWQFRRVVITKECISFAFVNRIEEVDRIPLEGVDYVKADDGAATKSDSPDTSTQNYVLQIATNPESYNSGRTYYLRTTSKETYDEIVPLLSNYAQAARERAIASTVFQRAQLRVRNVYQHVVCQSIFAMIIIGVSADDRPFLCSTPRP